MKDCPNDRVESSAINRERRRLLAATATGLVAASLGGLGCARAGQTLRWGVVGTGDTSNIHLQPDLEPCGAIGDTGWYNMRAIGQTALPATPQFPDPW